MFRWCVLALLVGSTFASPARAGEHVSVTPVHLLKDHAYGRRGEERVRLTVDVDLQWRIDRLLSRSRAPEGAIVMADPRTGQILAWASHGPIDLVRTPRYPAASVAKLVTATAALEEEVAFRGTSLCYSGGHRKLTEADVAKMCRPGEPRMAFGQALGRSVNVIFGRLGAHRLDASELRARAQHLSFEGRVPIDIDLSPNHIAYPDDLLGRARAAAGFHRGRVSPLALAYAMSAVARDGAPRPLRILAGSELGSARRVIEPAAAKALRKMLEVTTSRGTSRKAFAPKKGRPNVKAAGKTGTLGWPKPRRLLSWFAGYAPADAPEVVVAVLLANRPKWWRKANEVARDALDIYFTQHRSNRGPSKQPR